MHEGHTRLTGHVLCARPGERLSYLLQAEPADPPTYLTWLTRPSPSGCTITLVVDEPDTRDTAEDATQAYRSHAVEGRVATTVPSSQRTARITSADGNRDDANRERLSFAATSANTIARRSSR